MVQHAANSELVADMRAFGQFLKAERGMPDPLGRQLQSGKTQTVGLLLPHLDQPYFLRLLAEGLSAKEIARRLDISARTVESHKYQIMESLGAESSAQLIRIAIRHGIVDP